MDWHIREPKLYWKADNAERDLMEIVKYDSKIFTEPTKDVKFLMDDSVLTAEPGASGGVALGYYYFQHKPVNLGFR